MTVFVVRPSNSEKAPFRIHLTAASLLSLKLRPGDLCTLALPENHSDATISCTAIAWENSIGIKDSVIQVSKILQELYSLKLGDRVSVQRSPEELKDASEVDLQPLTQLTEIDCAKWTHFVSAIVPSKHEILAPRQRILIEAGYEKQEFQVLDVGGSLARVTRNTSFHFTQEISISKSTKLEPAFGKIGGLQHEVNQVNDFLGAFLDPLIIAAYPNYRRAQGILFWGPKGTGKSLMANAIAGAGWKRVIQWTPGVKLEASKDLRLILIDFQDFGMTDTITAELAAMFELLRETSTMVVGMSTHSNDVSPRLRGLTTLAVELEFSVPSESQRLEILKALRDKAHQPTDKLLDFLARKTHGFVGGDLARLMNILWEAVFRGHHLKTHDEFEDNNRDELPVPSLADADYALTKVRPSALQEVIFEKPRVYWSDIGGQEELKRKLQDAVERPLNHRDRMKTLGLEPDKGILLYGPPGCSKTMVVKALATETDVNFIAVKGAELVSMYVGESEKALREIFRKARQASPTIIFFDEIDSIASRNKTGSDLNVLTTLLNEMDGFEALKNVFVVAATNKPERIDPALLRPGRFDSLMYVGLPDLETRKDIFKKRLSNVQKEQEVIDKIGEFAALTEGHSGAEVAAICSKAGEGAFIAGRDVISLDDLRLAIQRSTKGTSTIMVRELENWGAKRNA